MPGMKFLSRVVVDGAPPENFFPGRGARGPIH